MAAPQSNFRRRMMALAHGGHVRGPGTGTSDSIPAMLSDGEFVLPADTVRKVGVKSLRDLVKSTHTPTGRPGHPAKFADGDLVDKKRAENSFGDAPASVADARFDLNAQTTTAPAPNQGVMTYGANHGAAGYNPSTRPPAAPKPPARMGDAMSAVLSEGRKEMQAHQQAGNTAAAVGASVRSDLAMVPAFLSDVGSAIARDAAPVVDSASRFTSSLFGGDGGKAPTDPAKTARAATQSAVAPPAPTSPGPSIDRTSPASLADVGKSITNATAAPVPAIDRELMTNAQVAAANPAGQVRAVRGANGVMEFSGSNVSGPVSYADAQGNAIAGQGIEGKGWGGGVTSMPARGFSPSTATSSALSGALSDAVARGDIGAVQQHYFNQGQSFGGKTEQQVRADNLMAQAQNLMNRGHVGDAQKAQMLLTSLGAMQDNASKMLSAQNTNAYQQGRLGLEARSQDEVERTGALDRQRTEQALEGDRQVAALRRTLIDPNATPEQKRQAQASLMSIQGKSAQGEWGIQVTPTTKNVDGSTTNGSIYRYNKQTGAVERVDSGEPPAKFEAGKVYTDAQGNRRRWDGAKFVAV